MEQNGNFLLTTTVQLQGEAITHKYRKANYQAWGGDQKHPLKWTLDLHWGSLSNEAATQTYSFCSEREDSGDGQVYAAPGYCKALIQLAHSLVKLY